MVKYIGEFERGVKNGFGIQFYSNGEKFEGSFYNNHIYGEGQFTTI